MSAAHDHFNRVLRGSDEPAPKQPQTKAEAFNALLRAYGTEDYDAAYKKYEQAERREKQGGDA